MIVIDETTASINFMVFYCALRARRIPLFLDYRDNQKDAVNSANLTNESVVVNVGTTGYSTVARFHISDTERVTFDFKRSGYEPHVHDFNRWSIVRLHGPIMDHGLAEFHFTDDKKLIITSDRISQLWVGLTLNTL